MRRKIVTAGAVYVTGFAVHASGVNLYNRFQRATRRNKAFDQTERDFIAVAWPLIDIMMVRNAFERLLNAFA